ncbi:MAG TPA: TlpA disulfide reductase family protein [Bacteroidales bacterium]|nr:TlpA disulfide reductase family protein [Bacteroidales bacterium]HOG66442.1 TlpA disulfide reductase family protein [Bacteroidales bacterium]HPA11964.1 TlpA disulfide reductase family protein [Bacteroidales bacterium]HQF00713.1 TlpA disulfide reductase family protein [Bacteroidales bacterium]HQH13763.1 TlpA disulfide reductase family protein [Bacteroidales bacterium]
MKKDSFFVILGLVIIVFASCSNQSKNQPANTTESGEQVTNQTLVQDQPSSSVIHQTPPELPPPGNGGKSSKTAPQTTITQPVKNQDSNPNQTTSTEEIVVGNEVGNDLGDFANYDPDSALIKLSSLNGKMVMVMLWNSLCHHCMVDNEKHREIYNKYHDKNFIHGKGYDIYAIGLDKERETWIKALNEKKYPWKNNVYVIDSWKDRDVRFFGVKNLPGTFLIDRNGIVVNKLFTPAELDKILESYLLK